MDDGEEEGWAADDCIGIIAPTADPLDYDGWMHITGQASSSTSNPPQAPALATFAGQSESLPSSAVGTANIVEIPSDDDDDIPLEGLDDDGFLLPNWAMDQTAVQETLLAFGLTGQRLALQLGDEDCLLRQILQQLGIEIPRPQFAWHLRQLKKVVMAADSAVPLAKRLRGDHLPYYLEGLRITDQYREKKAAAVSTPLELPPQFLLPPKGQRRNRLMAKATQLTKVDFEAQEMKKYVSQIVSLFEVSNAPVIEISRRAANPAQILRGALGDTRV